MNPGDSPTRAGSVSTSRAVASWHALLGATAVVNLALLALTAVAVRHAQTAFSTESDTAFRMQLLLCAAYVLGCAFRSVLPVYDVPRIVLIDWRLSSVIVGRSVATVAELCFAFQWALVLHAIALSSPSSFVQAVSLAIVPLIVLAEGWSWYAVLTTAQRGHVVENSLWGLSAALVVASLLVVGPHRLADLYPPMIIWCIGGAAYVAFIFLFDVPMYWSRWLADQAGGRQYLSITRGVVDVWRRRIVSYRWEDWKTEVVWMSLYFTLGVWCSISVVYASLALGAHRI
jgi:hypothetical protein